MHCTFIPVYKKYDLYFDSVSFLFFFNFVLGLFDCDEKKTGDVIKLLKDLTEKNVHIKDDDVLDKFFWRQVRNLIL